MLIALAAAEMPNAGNRNDENHFRSAADLSIRISSRQGIFTERTLLENELKCIIS